MSVDLGAADGAAVALPGGDERQIAVRLTTKDGAYSIPPTKFLVPANWRRFHLSELINKVLETPKPVPFDFLIDSTLLRTSLGQYCEQTGTSEEVTLEIEYLPSTLPPQLDSTLPSEDWISDVVLGAQGAILSASYAGTLSLSSPALPPPSNMTFSGHGLSVLSCCYVPNPNSQAGKQWVASGGMDRVARVWEYETPQLSLTNPSASTPAPTTLYTLPLHGGPVSSVRSRPPATGSSSTPHILTAGWDGLIGLWDLTPGVNEGEPEEDSGERKKKRRKQSGTVISKTPVHVLQGHTGKVSSAVFDRSSPNTAFSAGWDHSVRSWDLEMGAETAAKTSDKALYCLSQMASHNLLATGTSDRLVCFFDLRTSTTQNISLTLAGHTGPVARVAPHPTSSLMLASGSFDGSVRIWDARSPKQALFVLSMPPNDGEDGSGKVEKVLALDWDGQKLVAGGEGSRIVQWSVTEQGSATTESS